MAAAIGVTPDDIGGEDNLVFLGLGSLEMMRLVTGWRRAGVAVDFATLAADPTLRAWLHHLGVVPAADPAAGAS